MTALAWSEPVAPTVDIRLLGPVEMGASTGVVPLGGPRLRTLFGLLALRVPDVVSREALIDGIWDCDPPASAATTLRAHVAYLRRGFGAAGVGNLIATRPSGYALSVPPEWVDVHRFEVAVGTGRAACAAGDRETGADRLRTALGLWRGDVLADCRTGEWARAEATRLREVRLAATEELFATELALGDHARVTAELESLVARHPLREGLWELLMLSLYRSGRRGEALLTYRRARARLIEELGVEPGVGLRRLESAILAGDRVLADPAVSTTAPVPVRNGRSSTTAAVPSPLSRIVDRDAEVAELGTLLEAQRLVTLTGVGGCGKTRLAVAVATATVAGDGKPADGVRFVDLTRVGDPDLVTATVAATLGVPEDPARGPLDALVAHLRPLRCLLVLDNCEHVVRGCADLVELLLRSCPGVRVLATSRETLGIVGEYAWQVPLLSTPPDTAATSLASVLRYGAAQLFLERATPATVRGLTDADAPALRAICTGLDGLPLAIELAAARTAVLTITEIAERLDDPTLLSGRAPTDPPHHRALRETIAWSVDHLEPAVRSRFLRLAVFVGGFTLSAAEDVWPKDDDRSAMDVLTDLVTKSLVVMQRRPAGARYQLLDTIRRYAADRLAEHPADERTARVRHADAYLAMAEQADEQLRGPQIGGWLIRLAEEHENLRAALTWFAVDDPNSDCDLRMALALAQYCRLSGRYRDGRHWLEGALARHTAISPSTITTGRALAAAALFAFLVGDYAEAQAYAERALPVHRECHDEAGISRTLRLLASIARERGDYRHSLACLDESLGLTRDDAAAEADVLQHAGFTAWLAGSVDSADRLLRLALRRYERLGDAENVASTRVHLAAAALYGGRPDRARRLADAALECFSSLDVKEGIAWALNVLGLVAGVEGRWTDALAALCGSLKVNHALGDRWRQASLLDAMAAARLAGGDPTAAAELAGLAAMLRRLLDVPVPAVERPEWRRTHATLQQILPVTERRAAFARGGATDVADVLAES